MQKALSFFAIFVLVATSVYGFHMNPIVCNASLSDQSPMLPFSSLPSQFSTTVQVARKVVTEDSDDTTEYVVREYFDGTNSRGRLEVAARGKFSYAVYDTSQREAFVVDADGECTLHSGTNISSYDYSLLGLSQKDGSVQIGRVSDVLFPVNDYSSPRYISEATVRGIPCNWWQICGIALSTRVLYTIDYYFSRSNADWISAYGDDPIPVQIVVYGANWTVETNFTSIYSFTAFNGGSDSVPDDVFTIPIGTVCKGRGLGKPYPALPDYFSTFLELADSTDQTIRVFKEYYDLGMQLFRVDFYGSGREGRPDAPYTIIHDFNLETQYVINRQLRNCSVTAIKPDNQLFDSVVMDGQARLASPRDLLLLTNEFNYSYEGVSTVRGVEVESWISYREFEPLGTVNLTDTLYEIFFTRPEWSIETTSSPASSEPSLWQLKISGVITYLNDTSNTTQSEEFSSTFDFFGFSSGEPDLDEFDTSVCVSTSDYYIVILYIPTEGVDVDYLLLPRNVRSGLADFTDVQPLQIGNIQVTGANSTHLFLSLHISNLFNVSLPLVPSPVTANEAIDKIISSAKDNDNKLDFKIEIAPGVTETPTLVIIRNESALVYHASGRDTEESTTAPGRDTEESTTGSESGLSDGAIAGIAVWMLILGLGVGIVGTMCVFAALSRTRGKAFFTSKGSKASSVSYKRHVVVSTT